MCELALRQSSLLHGEAGTTLFPWELKDTESWRGWARKRRGEGRGVWVCVYVCVCYGGGEAGIVEEVG